MYKLGPLNIRDKFINYTIERPQLYNIYVETIYWKLWTFWTRIIYVTKWFALSESPIFVSTRFHRNTRMHMHFVCAFHVNALHARAFHAVWGFVRGGGFESTFLYICTHIIDYVSLLCGVCILQSYFLYIYNENMEALRDTQLVTLLFSWTLLSVLLHLLWYARERFYLSILLHAKVSTYKKNYVLTCFDIFYIVRTTLMSNFIIVPQRQANNVMTLHIKYGFISVW